MDATSFRAPRLGELPRSARVLLTGFLLLIGFGYLSALGNLYQRLELSDEQEGLSIDDLRANFHGLEVQIEDAEDGSGPVARAAMSRMLEQVQPGADMRDELVAGGMPAVRSLTRWLEGGALAKDFEATGLAQAGDPSAADTIRRYCLDCHNADGGENEDAPYGPDLFDVDLAMVMVYAQPGTAKMALSEADAADGEAGIRRLGPQSMAHLLLVSHIHMLAIPVYSLILGGLVLLTSLPAKFRGVLAVTPMLALIGDFGCWWLARVFEGGVYVIPITGGIYGASLATQLLCILGSTWFGRKAVA